MCATWGWSNTAAGGSCRRPRVPYIVLPQLYQLNDIVLPYILVNSIIIIIIIVVNLIRRPLAYRCSAALYRHKIDKT